MNNHFARHKIIQMCVCAACEIYSFNSRCARVLLTFARILNWSTNFNKRKEEEEIGKKKGDDNKNKTGGKMTIYLSQGKLAEMSSSRFKLVCSNFVILFNNICFNYSFNILQV